MIAEQAERRVKTCLVFQRDRPATTETGEDRRAGALEDSFHRKRIVSDPFHQRLGANIVQEFPIRTGASFFGRAGEHYVGGCRAFDLGKAIAVRRRFLLSNSVHQPRPVTLLEEQPQRGSCALPPVTGLPLRGTAEGDHNIQFRIGASAIENPGVADRIRPHQLQYRLVGDRRLGYPRGEQQQPHAAIVMVGPDIDTKALRGE